MTASQKTKQHRTIKSLVLDYVHKVGGAVDYSELTRQVKEQFPDSKWQRTHWAWYKNQILRARFREMFTDMERAALGETSGPSIPTVTAPAAAPQRAGSRGPKAADPEVKRLGDQILQHIRFTLDLAAGDDDLRRFKVNRWVFSRLLQDEIKVKRPIKKRLWDAGQQACRACGQPFKSLKGVEVHRKDAAKGYSQQNCELLCRECHQEIGRN